MYLFLRFPAFTYDIKVEQENYLKEKMSSLFNADNSIKDYQTLEALKAAEKPFKAHGIGVFFNHETDVIEKFFYQRPTISDIGKLFELPIIPNSFSLPELQTLMKRFLLTLPNAEETIPTHQDKGKVIENRPYFEKKITYALLCEQMNMKIKNIVNNPIFNNLGVGFFSRKTPTFIAKIRALLNAPEDKNKTMVDVSIDNFNQVENYLIQALNKNPWFRDDRVQAIYQDLFDEIQAFSKNYSSPRKLTSIYTK